MEHLRDVTGAQPVLPAIRRALAIMQANFAEPLTVAQLAAVSGLSPCRFVTVFRRQVGVPPHQYLCRLRVAHARDLLRRGVSAAETATEAGFFDQSHLSRHFKRICGVTPGRFAAMAGGAAGRAAGMRLGPPTFR